MFNFRKRLTVAVATAAVAAVALSGCSGSSNDSRLGQQQFGLGRRHADARHDRGVHHVRREQVRRGRTNRPYLQAVYDSLLHADPDGTIQPWLATEWEYNDDNTVLTMTLRDDVTFTDGTKFDASVAAQNLLRFRDGTSPQKGFLATLADAVAVDETTLELTLSAPNPSLLSFLAQNPGLQQSPATFDAPDEQTNPVGTGPYLLDTDATVVGSSYVFTKNPDYWAPEQQHYAKLVMNVYSTPTAVVNAISGGQIDGAPLLDNSTIAQMEGAGFTAHDQELNFFGVLLFDRDGTIAPALGDVRVRQAINYAVDREALLEGSRTGLWRRDVVDLLARVFGVRRRPRRRTTTTTPRRRKDLIAEAGYEEGEINLTMPSSALFAPATYALLTQYLADVGITVSEVNVAPTSFLGDLLQAKYAASVMSLKAAPTSWETITLDLLPNAGWNPFRTEDATVSELAAIVQTGSEEEAADGCEAAQRVHRRAGVVRAVVPPAADLRDRPRDVRRGAGR